MAWYKMTGKENHSSVFENISHDRCIFCGGLLELILLLCFRRKNTTQGLSASPVTMLTQSKLKLFNQH